MNIPFVRINSIKFLVVTRKWHIKDVLFRIGNILYICCLEKELIAKTFLTDKSK